MRRIALIVCGLLVLASIGCAAGYSGGLGGYGGGSRGWGRGAGGRGGFDRERFGAMQARLEAMRALDVESLWTHLCFGLELTEEQEQQVRALLKDTWERREQVIADTEGRKNADWEPIADEFKNMKKDLDKKLKEILTEEQQKKLADLEKQREKRMSQFQRQVRMPPF